MKTETQQAFHEHALAEYPRESCGVVIIERGKERYVACRNIAESPEREFVIHEEDYMAAEDRGEVVGICHSHTNGVAKPSPADLVLCEQTYTRWHIVGVGITEAGPVGVMNVHEFEPSGYEAPLVGREFVHGVLDCYTLIVDWYKRTLNVTLPDFERRDDWWNKGDDLYMQNFEAAGFVPATGELQIGDVILMQVRSPVANHAAIYIGDGQILHHTYQRLSTRDPYGGYWHDVTRKIVRYSRGSNDG